MGVLDYSFKGIYDNYSTDELYKLMCAYELKFCEIDNILVDEDLHNCCDLAHRLFLKSNDLYGYDYYLYAITYLVNSGKYSIKDLMILDKFTLYNLVDNYYLSGGERL